MLTYTAKYIKTNVVKDVEQANRQNLKPKMIMIEKGSACQNSGCRQHCSCSTFICARAHNLFIEHFSAV